MDGADLRGVLASNASFEGASMKLVDLGRADVSSSNFEKADLEGALFTEANLSFAYNINFGKVTVTPQLYLFQLFNEQTPTEVDLAFNPNGSFAPDFVPANPIANAGVQPGTNRPDGTACVGTANCTDNPDYRKAVTLTDPRLFRVALKVTF